MTTIRTSIIMKKLFWEESIPTHIHKEIMKNLPSNMRSKLEGQEAIEMVFELTKKAMKSMVDNLKKLEEPFKVIYFGDKGIDDECVKYFVTEEVEVLSETIKGSIEKSEIKKLLDEADENDLSQKALNLLFVKLSKMI